jgi:ribosomal protein S18 acetylase RimI-like enzyme
VRLANLLRMEGMEGMEGLVVEDGGVADLERLEPLWVAVHHQHQRAMPELAPYVSDATTWEERHALYRRLYAEHDPVLLLGRDADRLVGYALGYTMPVGGTWIADTWATGPHVAEIESLSVLPEWRGRGLGSRLLEELHERLRAQGASDFVLGALAGNADALRLYERHSYRPTWLYLSRFESRDRPGNED